MIYNTDGSPIDLDTSVNFSSKALVIMGDSVSDTAVNGKWIEPFTSMTNFKSIKNYARGYCRWTNWSTTELDVNSKGNTNTADNVIWNQYNRMKTDIDSGVISIPDVIFIFAGMNDALQNVTIGKPESTFTDTAQGSVETLTNLCDSIRYVLDLILTNYPNCKIILATPTIAKNAYEHAILVNDAIIRCGELASIPVINAGFEGGFCWFNSRQVSINFNTANAVHLTDDGGVKMARFFFKEFCNIFRDT